MRNTLANKIINDETSHTTHVERYLAHNKFKTYYAIKNNEFEIQIWL